VSIEPGLILGALAVGVLTSLAAAWIPARSAARVDPVQALQKGKYQVLSAGENRIHRILAALLGLVSAGCLLFAPTTLVFYAGYLLGILAVLLLTPTLALWLAHALRPFLKWFRPIEGALAADSLIQAPRRTSATVAAVMLSLAMAIGFGGVAQSIYDSLAGWLDNVLNPDLFVAPTQNLANRNFSFPGTMGAELAGIEGVEQVQMVKSSRIIIRQAPVQLVAVETAKLARTTRWNPLVGNREQMYRLTAQGKGLIVSDSFAGLRGVKLGAALELPTPNGLLRLPVVGITRDWSDDQGSILIDRSVYQRWWNDDSVHIFRVYLRAGASPADVKQRILERYAGLRRLFVLSNQEVRRYILRITDQWISMTYNQIALAVLVAVFGIINTLIVSITDRRRELGVLQAVGGLRRQVRHTVWMEALSIGMIGLILGLALGALDLYYNLEATRRDFIGMYLDYEYPMKVALLLVPMILGAAFIAALAPAESAVRGSLVEALEYE
jgi:putative ABC transport system permease protein